MNDKSNPYSAPDTGHVWDDSLRELTNNPPTWWRIGFHASWILVVVYWIIYPAIPLVDSHTKGIWEWTAIGEYREDMQAIEAVRSTYEDKLPGMSAAAIVADDEMSRYVRASGKVLFGDNCAACHGSKGQGNPGYPVLLDDDWLFGGSIDAIQMTITNGRGGVMPAKGGAQMSDAEVDEMANAIMAGKPTSSPLYMAKGCVGCHGMDGKGMHALGAANLTDSIYRFEASDQLASIKHTITHGVNDANDAETRNAVMPKFGGGKLTDTDLKKLTAYVHMLGGGQ